MQVAPEMDLEVAKADLSDYFHCCEAPLPVRPYLGLRRVEAPCWPPYPCCSVVCPGAAEAGGRTPDCFQRRPSPVFPSYPS